jgi:hypothetical protein
MDNYGQPMAQAQQDQVSFWEIFKNSWQVLWEKPKPLLIILVLLTVLTLVFDMIGNHILGPFNVLFMEAMQGKYNAQDFMAELKKLIEQQGNLPLILGKVVPWLFGPLANLTLARVALNLWDGYQIGLLDLFYALEKYLIALYITFILVILGLLMFILSFLSGLPMGLIHALAYGTGLPSPVFFFVTLFGFIASIFIFLRYVWPILRRYFFLNYMAFFSMVEGHSGLWTRRLANIFQRLKFYPHHLNQAIIIALAIYLSLFLVLSVISVIMVLLALPSTVVSFLTQFIYLIVASWLIVALSGFYRLCLAPELYNTNSQAPSEDQPSQDSTINLNK